MLIKIFEDYVYNKKDLREYVEKRKGINERGEFNNADLRQAQINIEKLKDEHIDVFNRMYETLDLYIKLDRGICDDYSINFIRAMLYIYRHDKFDDSVCLDYKNGLEHHFDEI